MKGKTPVSILLAIKPKWAKKIFSGEKKWEFRKQRPKEVPEEVIIYESFPTKRIVGWFTVKRIISGSPQEIWAKCKGAGGMEEKEFFNYCGKNNVVHALEIEIVVEFNTAINPFEIAPNFKPPQNFYYLANPTFLLRK